MDNHTHTHTHVHTHTHAKPSPEIPHVPDMEPEPSSVVVVVVIMVIATGQFVSTAFVGRMAAENNSPKYGTMGGSGEDMHFHFILL